MAHHDDIEKKGLGDRLPDDGVNVYTEDAQHYDPSLESRWTRWGISPESFKKAPGFTHSYADDGSGAVAGNTMLQHKFKNRHLQMIAVGGSIGTGLFIGSGGALRRGGPAGVLIAWIIMGVMLISTVQNIGEMAIMYPVTGGFYTLVSRFIDPSWGFAMGWNYVAQWAVVLPLELTAAAFTLQYWDKDGSISVAVWITVFFVVILILNLNPVGFAEEEFWTSCLKLLVVTMFLIASFIFVLGGGPSSGAFGEYWGARNYYEPGAFANGFKGVCSVFVTAAFSYAGTELVGLAATEHPNPRKALPSACKMTFWRVSFIYIMSLLFIGLLIRYDDENLIGGSYDANTSPFVRVFKVANVQGMDHLLNVTITISVLSIGMSCVYAGSRTLMALAEQGYAPRFFATVDKAGRPLWATVFILAFFPIAYANVADVGTQIFDWLLALSGLSTIVTWLSINVAHVRFRAAWKAQGHSLDELPFRAFGGLIGTWIAITLLVLVLIAQFYIAVWPLGGSASGADAAESFFLSYLAIPVMLMFYIIGVFWKKTRPYTAMEIDLVTGRKCFASIEELNAERAAIKALPILRRVKHAMFG